MKETPVLIGLLIIVLVLIIGCTNDSTPGYKLDKGRLVLDKEGTIPTNQCTQRGLTNQIVVLESKYCHACKEAVPKIKAVAQEMGATVTYLDLAENTDTEKANQLGVIPYYTPTMVVGCKVYVGGKTKTEYTKIIKEFLGK